MAPITPTTPVPGGSKVREPSLPVKLLTAGTAACVADLMTFPLDTAKVRLQIQGEGAAQCRHFISAAAAAVGGSGSATVLLGPAVYQQPRYHGMVGTVLTIAREEGPKSLYNGLVAGLQRQMCFASIRIGLYDSIKVLYQSALNKTSSGSSGSNSTASIPVRICAGITTGGLAVLFAQPTDVVKVRMQAQARTGVSAGGPRYHGTMHAYSTIARTEGMAGLWKGTFPNVSRNAIVNVAEIVCYDLFKELILRKGWMKDGVPCHFTSAVAAGFCTTVVASPVDVVKTRFMNASPGQYKGAIDCAVRMMVKEGPTAFYKGFMPSFSRLVSWNICMWITYEQFKKVVLIAYNQPTLHKL